MRWAGDLSGQTRSRGGQLVTSGQWPGGHSVSTHQGQMCSYYNPNMWQWCQKKIIILRIKRGHIKMFYSFYLTVDAVDEKLFKWEKLVIRDWWVITRSFTQNRREVYMRLGNDTIITAVWIISEKKLLIFKQKIKRKFLKTFIVIISTCYRYSQVNYGEGLWWSLGWKRKLR